MKRFLPLVGVSLVVIAGACASGDPTAAAEVDSAAAGAYVLQSVNGATLPHRLPDDPGFATWNLFMQSATLTLATDGTFTDNRRLLIEPHLGDPFARQEVRTGTWREIARERFELAFDQAEAFGRDTVQLAGELLLRSEPGAAYLYTR